MVDERKRILMKFTTYQPDVQTKFD